MLPWLVAAVLVLAGGVEAEASCGQCGEAATQLATVLQSAPVLQLQAAMLQRQVCPQVSPCSPLHPCSRPLQHLGEEASQCEALVASCFPALASCLHRSLQPRALAQCGLRGDCGSPAPSPAPLDTGPSPAPSCQDCREVLARMAEFMVQESCHTLDILDTK